jgi:hypothetical protein
MSDDSDLDTQRVAMSGKTMWINSENPDWGT